MGDWPVGVASVGDAGAVLASVWAHVAAHGCAAGAPPGVVALFGSKSVDIDGSRLPGVGGPRFGGAYGPDVVPDVWAHPRRGARAALPARLFLTDSAGWLSPVGAPDEPDFWRHPIDRNAPLSAERGRVGVVAPPYPETPSGARSGVLAALSARGVAEILRETAENGAKADLGRALRGEAGIYERFAGAAEAAVIEAAPTWLALANEWLPTRPTGAGVPRVAATLRR